MSSHPGTPISLSRPLPPSLSLSPSLSPSHPVPLSLPLTLSLHLSLSFALSLTPLSFAGGSTVLEGPMADMMKAPVAATN